MNFSRDPERTPYQWDDSKNAGFSSAEKTWLPVNPNYQTLNLKAQKEAESSHFKFYQKLAEIRKRKTFVNGDFKIKALSSNVFAYVRELRGEDTFVVVINLGPNDETVNLKTFSTLKDRLVVVLSSGKDYMPG
jgi:alpha-glucosidase